jgi:hypothetical protein
MRAKFWLAVTVLAACALSNTARAGSFFFSTGNPDGRMAMASRPSSAGKIEIEAADDFVLTSPTSLTSATFTGLLPTGAALSSITDVRVEIYRVFPNDSDVGRTSGPPTFSTSQVPTRVNSPSDVEFDDRSASAHNLSFTPGIISPTFTAANSVLNGIHAAPGFHTGGDGAVTGQEVQFNVLFSKPFSLPADHYFFVPQVQLSSGDFFWLSAPRPIVSPGTPFPPGVTDLQAWIRNEDLAPDWLRVGADIVGGTTFNATFSLAGQSVPEPSSVVLMSLGGLGLIGAAELRRRRAMRKSYGQTVVADATRMLAAPPTAV